MLRLKGPPIETISCDVEIDATDQLAASNATAMSLGIQPQLAVLELLVYPSSAILIANEVLSLVGTIEILPMSSNLTQFAWGPNRVTPVRLTSIEHYGTGIRSEVESDPGEGVLVDARVEREPMSDSDARRRDVYGLPVGAKRRWREGHESGSEIREGGMDNALAAMWQAAAGTGAPANPNSRYYGFAVEQTTLPDGTQVAYLARRIIPAGEYLRADAELQCRGL